MTNPTHRKAIAKHAGVLPSQLRELSNNSYFIDANISIDDLVDTRNHIKVTFNQILVGNIANVVPLPMTYKE